MLTDTTGESSFQKWQQFIDSKPDFPAVFYRWLLLLRNIAIHTSSDEQDLIGHLLMTGLTMSIADVDDILTLSYHNSHVGAQKLLRSLYERVVTLKYIQKNPGEAQAFVDFDSIDTQKVIKAIEAKTGLKMDEVSRNNLDAAVVAARKRYKQASCVECGATKPLSWTALNSKDMADQVGLGHMYLHAFLIPSKHMHPTYWGIRDMWRGRPVFTTLNSTHELMVQLILLHRRHFAPGLGVTPMMNKAIDDFLRLWTLSEGTFDGLLTKFDQPAPTGQRLYFG